MQFFAQPGTTWAKHSAERPRGAGASQVPGQSHTCIYFKQADGTWIRELQPPDAEGVFRCTRRLLHLRESHAGDACFWMI